MGQMKKMSILLIVCVLLTGCSNAARTDMPKDFAFSYVWGTGGNNSYHSADGALVKKQNATESKSGSTTLKLTEGQLEEVWSIISEMDMDSYPNTYDPNPNQESEPSLTLILSVSYDGFQKEITCRNISMTYESSSEEGQRFLSACKSIENIIVSSDEWKALPDYGNYQ